jgi:hypothetical protein
MQCVSTAALEGGSCSATTSADAIMPGLAPGGSRSVWELGQVRVADGGADGLAATSPNEVFAVQGVYVP